MDLKHGNAYLLINGSYRPFINPVATLEVPASLCTMSSPIWIWPFQVCHFSNVVFKVAEFYLQLLPGATSFIRESVGFPVTAALVLCFCFI